jgi:CCR4-NOT transcriptional regulation complex NOT5 subunit
LQKRYENLQNDDPDLRDLAEEQFRILRDYVGKEFKSIHQYMVIKSSSKEALRVANNILQSEVENSSLFIKQCVPLEKDDTLEVLRSIYQKGGA